MKAFIISQFSYCPLLWMYHNRTLNNKINRLHERSLRIVYTDPNLTFEEMLVLDNSVTIHQKNLQKLATEMYKVKNNLAPKPVCEIFRENTNPYNLRKKRSWERVKTRTSLYGTETIRYQGPKIWDLLPEHVKNAGSLREFKQKIKSWKTNECPCRLCKTFIPELGFIDNIIAITNQDSG